MPIYEHRGGAEIAALTSQITAGDTTFGIDSANGWPSANFFAVIDRGLSTEEKVLVTTRTGTSLEGVLRGQDDTIQYPHDSGAQVEHVFTALEASAANEHVESVGGVHGLPPGVSPASQQEVFTLGNNVTSLEAQLLAEIGQKDNEITSLQTELNNLAARVTTLEGGTPGDGDQTGLVDPAIVRRIGAHASLIRNNFSVGSSSTYLNLSSGNLSQSGTTEFTKGGNGIKVPWDGAYKIDIHFAVEGSSNWDERLEISTRQGPNGTEAQPFALFVKRNGDTPPGTGSYEVVGSGRLSIMDAGDLVTARHFIVSGRNGVDYTFFRLSVAYIGPCGTSVVQ